MGVGGRNGGGKEKSQKRKEEGKVHKKEWKGNRSKEEAELEGMQERRGDKYKRKEEAKRRQERRGLRQQ